jgi:hypothetical protein
MRIQGAGQHLNECDHGGGEASRWMLLLSFAFLCLIASMSCIPGHSDREETMCLQGRFTVIGIDSTLFDYNLIVLCKKRCGPFVILSPRDSNYTGPADTNLEKIQEGQTYSIHMCVWEVMDQPIVHSLIRTPTAQVDSTIWHVEPCKPGGDSLAFLFSRYVVRTRIYRSDDIVGLYVRVNGK